jgi:hypothetical protein
MRVLVVARQNDKQWMKKGSSLKKEVIPSTGFLSLEYLQA